MRRTACALAALSLLAAAAPADAARVTRMFPIDPTGAPYGDGTAVFAAAPGEINQVEIRLDDASVTLIDVNPVEAHACTQIDPRTVRCPRGGLRIELGDGDDAARMTDTRDPGAERNSVTTFSAGPGADAVTGGPLREVFVDGGTGEADRFTGGGGNDEVSYGGRGTPVRVVLGSPGEDVLDGIPSVTGGSGNDVLIGDERANALSGGAGDDRLEGRAGDDALQGDGNDDRLLGGAGDDSLAGDLYASATGRDVFDGGPGDDRLDLSAADDDFISIAGPTYDPLDDDRRDIARCGSGLDTTFYLGANDVASGCEAVDAGGIDVARRVVRVSPSRVRLKLVQGEFAYDTYRVYLVRPRGPRTRLTRPARLGAGRSVTLRLTAAGRRYLRGNRAVRIVIPSLEAAIDGTVTR